MILRLWSLLTPPQIISMASYKSNELIYNLASYVYTYLLTKCRDVASNILQCDITKETSIHILANCYSICEDIQNTTLKQTQILDELGLSDESMNYEVSKIITRVKSCMNVLDDKLCEYYVLYPYVFNITY
jgi:hypothetical protein